MNNITVRDIDGDTMFVLFEDGHAEGDFAEQGEQDFEDTGSLEGVYSLYATASLFTVEGDITLEALQLFNPYHDERGRFTTSKGSQAGSGVLARSVEKPLAGYGDAEFSEKETKAFVSRVGAVQDDLSGMMDGYVDKKVIPTHSIEEYAEKTGLGKQVDHVAGVAFENGLYLHPKITRVVAGRVPTKEEDKRDFSTDDWQKMGDHVVAHESIHARQRKYPIPYQKDGRSISGRDLNVFMEEGATEALTQVFLSRKRGYTAHDRSRFCGYKPFVYAFAAEARARYPKSPDDALRWMSKAHQTGFTPKGITESFGDRFYVTNRPTAGVGANFWRTKGKESDLEWICGAAKDIRLEEENPMSEFYGLFVQKKFAEAMDDYEADPTPDKYLTISTYLARYATEEEVELIVGRLDQMKETTGEHEGQKEEGGDDEAKEE